MIHCMQGELCDSQVTLTPGLKDKGEGKAKEVIVDSDIKELDGQPSSKPSSSKRQ